jgi:competence protein ComEA
MSRALLATVIVTSGDVVFTQKAAGKPAAAAPAVVNLNTATATQIATLPGVGEKAAQRIIEYREKNGGFKKIEELMTIKGIGEKSFLKLKPLVTVAPEKERSETNGRSL